MKILLIGDAFKDVWVEYLYHKQNPEINGGKVFIENKKIICDGGVLNTKHALYHIDNLEGNETPLEVDCFISKTIPKKTRHTFGEYVARVDSDEFKIKPAQLELGNKYDCIIISDYNKGSIDKDSITKFLAAYNDTPIFVDTKPKNFQLYKNVTCITPNIKEIISCEDFDGDIKKTALRLAKKLNTTIVLTTGEEGCSVVSDKITDIKTTKTDLVNVCGAGDVFLAALAYYMTVVKEDILLAAKYATRIASYSVEFKYTGFQILNQ